MKFLKQTIRQTFQVEMIVDGEVWLETLQKRDLTTHTYDENSMEKLLDFLEQKFMMKDLGILVFDAVITSKFK